MNALSLEKIIKGHRESLKYTLDLWVKDISFIYVNEIDLTTLRESLFKVNISNKHLVNYNLDAICIELTTALTEASPNSYRYNVSTIDKSTLLFEADGYHQFYFPATDSNYDANHLLDIPQQDISYASNSHKMYVKQLELFSERHLQLAIQSQGSSNTDIVDIVHKYSPGITINRYHLCRAIEVQNDQLVKKYGTSVKAERVHITKAIQLDRADYLALLWSNPIDGLTVNARQYDAALAIPASKSTMSQLLAHMENNISITL